MSLCPCGSNKKIEICCAPYISGHAIPETPEALMRSRYTAYTQANIDYIAATMKGPALQQFNHAEAEAWAKKIVWQSLNVIRTNIQPPKGWVEFWVKYTDENRSHFIHELSEFHLENGRWFYISGMTPKVGRNDPCPCGSGRKFKKCCGDSYG